MSDMKSRTMIPAAVLIVLGFAAVTSCDKTDPTAPDNSTINVTANPASLRLSPGQTGRSNITAVVEASDGRPLSGIRVRFETNAGSLASGADGATTNSNGVATDVLTMHFGDDDATVTARASGATTDSVTVTAGSNAAPVAVPHVSPTSGHLNDTIHFDGASSTDSDGNITAWKWTLSYPGSTHADEDSTASVFDKTFPDERTVHVTLMVTDNDGKVSPVATFTPDIRILGNFPPTAVISGVATRTVQVNNALVLDGTPSHDSSLDTGGSIQAYDWDWGDGNQERTTTPTKTHTYSTTSGSPFAAKLVVWDNGTGTTCVPIGTYGTPPCTGSKASESPATVLVTVTP